MACSSELSACSRRRKFGMRSRSSSSEIKAFLICGQQTIHALANTSELPTKSFLAPFRRIGLTRGHKSAVDFFVGELGLFEQPHDFRPHDIIQQILTPRAGAANRTGKAPPSVGARTAVVADYTCARSRRRAV